MDTRRHHDLPDGRTLLIREASGTDAQAVLDFVEAVSGESDYLSFGPGEFELGVEQEREFLEASRASEHQVYLLGVVDGALVGTLHFASRDRPRIRHTGEFGMSVRRSAWGQGIGSALLTVLLDWARGTGIVTKINLRVRADNPRAISLYERHGFVHEGTISRDIRHGGRYFPSHCMGIEL